ncbi:MAG: class I SAM-dependent methyltransferase [Lewinellaceae bacterium]|nr:class I SAM-dependent methyltransferase [Lewinellaceae bacterium]
MNTILNSIRNTDIYLLDQILKGRYHSAERILDAGTGNGRNLPWFFEEGCEVHAVDLNEQAIHDLNIRFPKGDFQVASVAKLPYRTAFFEHIICCAVLHFAENEAHFHQMFAELIRVMRPGGSLFIRMASNIGFEDRIVPLGNGRYRIPDGSERFLLTRTLLQGLVQSHGLELLEPVKTVNVSDLRAMTTLVVSGF